MQYLSKSLVTIDLATGDETSFALSEPEAVQVVESARRPQRNVRHESRNVTVKTDAQGTVALETVPVRRRNPRRAAKDHRKQPPMIKPPKVGRRKGIRRALPYTRGILKGV